MRSVATLCGNGRAGETGPWIYEVDGARDRDGAHAACRLCVIFGVERGFCWWIVGECVMVWGFSDQVPFRVLGGGCGSWRAIALGQTWIEVVGPRGEFAGGGAADWGAG